MPKGVTAPASTPSEPSGSGPVPVPATAFAADLLVSAAAGGVRDLVVCPGSRSQALALVAAQLEQTGRVRLHVRHDERSAAFFALGLARESGRPVPVITTSGTAAANLHPAMLEAFHAGVPLVAITADRPVELVGVGANQSTVQPGIYGPRIPCRDISAPEGAADEPAVARSLGAELAATRGPLHLNLAFRDPLSSVVPNLAPALAAAEAAVADAPDATSGHDATGNGSPGTRIRRIDPSDGVPTLVIAGDLAGPRAEQTAHEGGWPLIAEVSSGARFGRNLVVAFRELLGVASPEPELHDLVGRVIVYGHPTLSREVPALVARPDIEVIVVGDTGGEPYGAPADVAERVDAVEIVVGATPSPYGATTQASTTDETPGADPENPKARLEPRRWLRAWVTLSQELAAAASSDPAPPDLEAARATDHVGRSRFARAELEIARQPVDRELLVDAVWRATWPHDRLVLGASRLVRVLDGRAPGKPLRVHANRGLAGIDGTIATALGVASASQRDGAGRSAGGMTRVLLGDLTFLHDAGSLLVGQGGEAAPRLQIIVGNDRGGTIFEGLEVARVAPPEAFERVQLTPHEADLEAIARAYGWHYERAATRAALEAALTSHEHGRVVIEVPLER